VSISKLGSEDLRRIFRDFLKGVPKTKAMRKYDLTEDEYWAVVAKYHKPRGYKNAKEQAAAKTDEAPKAEEAPATKTESNKGPTVLTLTPKPAEKKP
jgi:hypothetical protein